MVLIAVLLFPVAYLLGQAASFDALAALVPPVRLLELTVNTLALAVVVVLGALAVGTATAWVIARRQVPGRSFWSTVVALPLVMPSYVLALVVLGATGNRGVLSQLSQALGGSSVPIPRGFLGAALVLTVSTYPYVHLSLVPALRGLDPALEEAARSLGARRGHRFRTILLPQLAPALRSSGLIVALYTIADFGAVSLLSYDTFTRAVFLQYAGRIDRRPATLLSASLLVLAVLLLVVVRRPKIRPAPASVPRRPPDPRPAGIGARLFLMIFGLVVVALPIIVLGGWWWRGIAAGRQTVAIWEELSRSLAISVAGALLIALLALPLAVLTVRFRSVLGRLADTVAWSVSALPHLTVGLAVLLVGVNLLQPLYQTLALLLLAYLTMFLPQALAPLQTALARVSPQLEEASRSLGRRALATFRHVTFPLVAPGFFAGVGLVFLTTMKELPATLLLRPTGYETLAVRIWSTTSEGFYTRAAVAALALIAVSAVLLYFLVIKDGHDG